MRHKNETIDSTHTQLITRHYKTCLDTYYSWMFGEFEKNIEKNIAFFRAQGFTSKGSGNAVDLGCGPGFHSGALAQLGYRVLSIDLSEALLDELKINTAGKNITTIKDDILNLDKYAKGDKELVICMGDTLTHLESISHIRRLFDLINTALEPGGNILLSYRNLSTELVGTNRIIPVKSDESIIMTTFLEYFSNHVVVNDMVYEKTDTEWKLTKSYYKKLRLETEAVVQMLCGTGFSIDLQEENFGLVTIKATK